MRKNPTTTPVHAHSRPAGPPGETSPRDAPVRFVSAARVVLASRIVVAVRGWCPDGRGTLPIESSLALLPPLLINRLHWSSLCPAWLSARLFLTGFLSVCLSVPPTICLLSIPSACLCFCWSICSTACGSAGLFIHFLCPSISFCLSVLSHFVRSVCFLAFCLSSLSAPLFIHSSVCLPACLSSVCLLLSVSCSVCLSIPLRVFLSLILTRSVHLPLCPVSPPGDEVCCASVDPQCHTEIIVPALLKTLSCWTADRSEFIGRGSYSQD